MQYLPLSSISECTHAWFVSCIVVHSAGYHVNLRYDINMKHNQSAWFTQNILQNSKLYTYVGLSVVHSTSFWRHFSSTQQCQHARHDDHIWTTTCRLWRDTITDCRTSTRPLIQHQPKHSLWTAENAAQSETRGLPTAGTTLNFRKDLRTIKNYQHHHRHHQYVNTDDL